MSSRRTPSVGSAGILLIYSICCVRSHTPEEADGSNEFQTRPVAGDCAATRHAVDTKTWSANDCFKGNSN